METRRSPAIERSRLGPNLRVNLMKLQLNLQVHILKKIFFQQKKLKKLVDLFLKMKLLVKNNLKEHKKNLKKKILLQKNLKTLMILKFHLLKLMNVFQIIKKL